MEKYELCNKEEINLISPYNKAVGDSMCRCIWHRKISDECEKCQTTRDEIYKRLGIICIDGNFYREKKIQ
jgi:hypothetical protein